MISGIVISILMIAFLGLVRWAWSSRRQDAFARAAATPLTDEGPKS